MSESGERFIDYLNQRTAPPEVVLRAELNSYWAKKIALNDMREAYREKMGNNTVTQADTDQFNLEGRKLTDEVVALGKTLTSKKVDLKELNMNIEHGLDKDQFIEFMKKANI